VKPVRGHINYSLLVPAGEYVEGFANWSGTTGTARPHFFWGRYQSGGWKMYYPTAILLKWPTVCSFWRWQV